MAANVAVSKPVQRIAEEIIKQLENGTAPWIQPWLAGSIPDGPMNATTGNQYKGLNKVLLFGSMQDADPRFCTIRQANKEGWRIRKGARGYPIVFWKFEERIKTKSDNGLEIEVVKPLEHPIRNFSFVYHALDIEGIPDLPEPELKIPEWDVNERAESILTASGAQIVHDGKNRAFYSVVNDQIHLPNKGAFPKAEGYYATALHELCHWSGHKARLNRDMGGRFGGERYAKEELNAEIASWLLCTNLGVGHDPRQHMGYVEHWIKAIKEDPNIVLRASQQAVKIANWIETRGWEQVQEQSGGVVEPVPMISASNATSTMQSGGQPMNKTAILYVPYAEKDEASKLGARWDKEEKHWYVPAGVAKAQFGPWLEKRTIEPALSCSPQEAFKVFLESKGLVIDGEVVMDGELRRVPVKGDNPGQTSGAYTGYSDGQSAGFVQNWKTDIKEKWVFTGQRLDEAQKEELAKQATIQAKQREEERENVQIARADELVQEFDDLPAGSTDHDYLQSHSADGANYGTRLDDKNNLVVPMRDNQGKLWSVLRISTGGFKKIEKGSRALGMHHVIPATDETRSEVLVTSGFGTAACLSKHTGCKVYVAFSDHNLPEIAKLAVEEHKPADVYIMGDDDHAMPAKGKPNKGRDYATKASVEANAALVMPEFNKQDANCTDFADAASQLGDAGLKEQLARTMKLGATLRTMHATTAARNQDQSQDQTKSQSLTQEIT